MGPMMALHNRLLHMRGIVCITPCGEGDMDRVAPAFKRLRSPPLAVYFRQLSHRRPFLCLKAPLVKGPHKLPQA